MATPETSNKDIISIKVDKLQEELKKNPKNPENAKIRGEIAELRRELNRTKQFTTIAKEGSKKIAEGKNMDTLSAAELMRIDREEGTRSEFLSKSFLYKQKTDNEGNIFQEATDGKNIGEGDTIFVDFGKNKSANNKIGLGHMLSTDIGYVKVNGKIGLRSIVNNRVGYYTENSAKGYIPVFTGDIVTIPTATEIFNFEKQKDTGLSRNTDQKVSEQMNDLYIEKLEQLPESSNIEVSTLMRESYDFLKGKGLTEEQIAGIIANEYQESGCNPRANNDNVSFGIFQWKPDRIDKIKKTTGIDIYTANHADQLKAFWWEMTEDSYEKKVYSLLKEAKTPTEAASIFVREFERPADSIGEPIKRGKIAENIYTQFRFINNPELANIAEGPANQAIISIALDAQKQGNILGAEHCSDWVDKIYSRSIGKSVYSTNLYYNGIENISTGTKIGGTPATNSTISGIKPGMHIIVDKPNNAGEYNQGKTHSIIALSAPIDGLVKVVSYPNGGIPPKIETYDLYAQSRGDKDGKPLRIQGV